MPGLTLTVRAGELQREVTLSQQQAQRLHANIWSKLRAVSFALERRIKQEMPVDTGRARASWGHWTPGDVAGNKQARATDAMWSENSRDLKIEQGSNVDYIEGLNAGNSKQAPAGFIDVAEAVAVRELNAEIDQIIARTL